MLSLPGRCTLFTFWDNVSVPPSGVKNFLDHVTDYGINTLFRNVCIKFLMSCQIPEKKKLKPRRIYNILPLSPPSTEYTLPLAVFGS